MSPPGVSAAISRGDRVLFGVCTVLTVFAAVVHYASLNETLAFAVSGLALAVLAALVGRSVDQLGDRLGAGATGVLHAALGNLPELFVGIFALRQGLVDVVDAAVIGSILSNLLLVLGLSFVVGGLRHGPQRFSGNRARTTISLMLLAVAAMLVPSLASYVHTPAAQHEQALSIIAAVVLLAVFLASIPASLARTDEEREADDVGHADLWPMRMAVVTLAVASLLSAFASDWFVDALTPAIHALNISQTFAGLVIVALAGNAVENVVGIQLAAKGRADYALSVVLNSPLQIALFLAPVLVLLSLVIAGPAFLLVFPPLLVTTLVASVLVVSFVIVDGESDWLEGSALVGLYVVIAASFWWG